MARDGKRGGQDRPRHGEVRHKNVRPGSDHEGRGVHVIDMTMADGIAVIVFVAVLMDLMFVHLESGNVAGPVPLMLEVHMFAGEFHNSGDRACHGRQNDIEGQQQESQLAHGITIAEPPGYATTVPS